MPLQVGNIVTVLLECRFEGKQGRVSAIVHDDDEDGPIEVWFGPECEDLLGPSSQEANNTRFLETELQIDEDWSPETIAYRLFAGSLSYFYDLGYPFVPGSECILEGCPHKAVIRGVCNVYGSVYALDLCEVHKEEYHGKCGEVLPELKPEQESVA